MVFCTECGSETQQVVPTGDNRPRSVCASCGHIQYQNPKIVAGCLVRSGSKVLLCKRAIPPREGLWTFPAGFVELAETNLKGAIRETKEEANANVDVEKLYLQADLAYISQVYQFFLADLVGDFAAGVETTDVRLFEEEEIPWDELAFQIVSATLKMYFEDRGSGDYRFRYIEINTRSDWDKWVY